MTPRDAATLADQVVTAVRALDPRPALAVVVLHQGTQTVGMLDTPALHRYLVAALRVGWRPAGVVGLMKRPGGRATVLCWPGAGAGMVKRDNWLILRGVVRHMEARARALGIPVTPAPRPEWN